MQGRKRFSFRMMEMLLLGAVLCTVPRLYAQTEGEEPPVAGSPSATVVDTENPEYVPLTPQQLRDSIRRAKILGLTKSKGETVCYYDYSMQCGLPVFDSMRYPLAGFQTYDAAYLHNEFRNSRGVTGMPDQLLEFYPASCSGFKFRTHPFSAWFYTPQNLPFYQTKNPYTYLYWVNNFSKELNIFTAAFHHNVARGLNIGVDFNVYDIYGAYSNSKTAQYNIRGAANYISRDARYRLMVAYFFNEVTFGENGGIQADSLFTDKSFSSRLGIPVNLSSATGRWREHRAFVKHSYHFYRDHKDSIAENNRSFGYITHEFDLTDNRISYNDETTPADGFYRNFFINDKLSADTVDWMKITNRVFYSTADMEYIPFGYRFKAAGGFRNEYVRFVDKMRFKDWVQWFPFAQIQVDFADRFVFDAYADFGLGGYNQFDLSGRVMFKYLFKDDRERTLSKRDGIEARLGVNRYAPDFLYTYHASNHFYWENDWEKTLEAYAQLGFSYKGWWVRAKGALLQNYIFLKQEGPVRAEDAFWLVNVTAGKKIRFCKYVGLDNLLMFSYSGNQSYLHLPLFSLRESLYGVIPVKNIAEIHIGLEVMYNTAYYADGYNPALMGYYWQNDVKTGNFPYLDVYINFQVKRANIFLKCANVTEGLFGYRYIQTPHYPLQDRNFRFGVSWRFFD